MAVANGRSLYVKLDHSFPATALVVPQPRRTATEWGPALAWPPLAWPMALAALALATVLVRTRYLGDPLIDVDEQFYLLVGDRMLHGAIPYVDIWDRKPVGLFLLYAAIRLLGGAGIVQYQLIAAGFAAATAVMIAWAARRIASPGAALVAGLSYAPALAMSGGAGGQTPVFYNLPMIVAVWLVLRVAAPQGGRAATMGAIRRHGAAAMLLVGVALQIKYSAVFEGIYLGLVLSWLGWRRAPGATRLADMALWAGLALLPTALALGWYVAIGQGHAFVFANFTSIFERGGVPFHQEAANLRRILVRLLPFALAIGVGARLIRSAPHPWATLAHERAARRFLAGWLAVAVTGFAAFGTFFDHYALPLLPPLAVVAAPAFAIRRGHAGAIIAAVVLLALYIPYPLDARKIERRHGDAATARALAAAIAPRLHGRCLYVFYGDPILYQLTHSCLPTRWPFPFHLSLWREAPALGVDAMAEERRILAARPPVIVDRITNDPAINRPVQAIVRAELKRDYRLVFSQPLGPGGTGFRSANLVWARVPGR